jgi:hypothetical protein
MGTNFYWTEQASEVCPHCGKFNPGEKLHIGKSSAGWCFSLHIIPEKHINNLEDWKKLWNERKGVIRDEYDETLTVEQMLDRITNRSWQGNFSTEFMQQNHATRGPNGLLRHLVDGYRCVGNGSGTWDYIAGEFS